MCSSLNVGTSTPRPTLSGATHETRTPTNTMRLRAPGAWHKSFSRRRVWAGGERLSPGALSGVRGTLRQGWDQYAVDGRAAARQPGPGAARMDDTLDPWSELCVQAAGAARPHDVSERLCRGDRATAAANADVRVDQLGVHPRGERPADERRRAGGYRLPPDHP